MMFSFGVFVNAKLNDRGCLSVNPASFNNSFGFFITFCSVVPSCVVSGVAELKKIMLPLQGGDKPVKVHLYAVTKLGDHHTVNG